MFPVRALFCALLLACLPLTPAAAQSAASPTQADREIQFWQPRLDRDPDDYLPPTKLGVAYLQKARESGDFAYYLKAQEALKKALERKPGHYTAVTALASAYAAQHRFREAVTLAEQAVKQESDDAYAYGILGDALLEMGEVRRAEGIYRRLLKLAPGLFSLSRMANLQHLKGDVEGALTSLARAAEAGKKQNVPAESLAWCHVQMGEMNWSRGRWAEAERHYRRALAITPNGYLPQEHLAELRAAQGKHQEALERYRKVIALAPHPDFHAAIAVVLSALGRRDEARAAREEALRGYLAAVEQGNVGYYRHLAFYYADTLKDGAEALQWARKDLEVRRDVHAYDALAWAHYRAGELPEARAASRKALALGTADADLYYHAGIIARRSGDAAGAGRYLRRALALNPRHPSAGEMRALLAGG